MLPLRGFILPAVGTLLFWLALSEPALAQIQTHC